MMFRVRSMRKDDISFIALFLIPPLIPALILFKYIGIESLLLSIASISAGILFGFAVRLSLGGSPRPKKFIVVYTIALACIIVVILVALSTIPPLVG